MACKLVIQTMLLSTASALRKHKGRKQASKAELGEVAALYTWGAPGVARGGVRNEKSSDGCFAGVRFWTFEHQGLLPAVDLVPVLTRPAAYAHPYVDGKQIDVNTSETRTWRCSEDAREAINRPRLRQGLWRLHSSNLYVDNKEGVYGDLVGNLTYLATRSAKVLDPNEMKIDARNLGWRLVATGYDDGSGGLLGGPQSAHLLQHPESLECMITLRGSSSTGDYLADADIRSSEFCGFEQSFHRGFRDHFRRISRTEGWQNSIRQALPSCSKFYSTGHSLAGAMASLLAACVQKAPQPGQPGYEEDFKYLSWNKGTSQLLPEWSGTFEA